MFLFPAWADSWKAGDYKGKYAETPFGKKVNGSMGSLRDASFQRVEKRLGIVPDPDLFLVEVRDAEGMDGKALKKWDRRAAEARRDGAKIVLTVYLEPIASGESDAHAALALAVAEGLFLARYDDRQLKQRIPEWALEGCCLYAAGTDEAASAAADLLSARRRPPETLLVELESGKEGASLAQSFWAFLYLEKKCGAKGVQQFARALYEGKPHDQELMAVTGLAWGPLMAEMEEFARKQLSKLCEGAADFAGLSKKIRDASDGEKGRFAQDLSRLIAAHPGAYWERKGKYLLGQCMDAGGRRQEAAKLFTELFSEKPPLGDFVADGRYRLGLLLKDQMRRQSAAEQLEAVARDHFDEPLALYSMWELAQIAAESRDEKGQIRWLEAMAEKFPDHKFTDRAREKLKQLDKPKK